MKTKIILVLALFLMSASCSIGGAKGVVAGTVKTVNGGSDWQFMNSIKDSKSTIAGLNVSKMVFDPSNRQQPYVGGYNGGLYKWEDSTNTWKEILSNVFVYDFVISPNDNKVIYAAGLFNNHGRVLVTKDGGATWTQIFNDSLLDNAVRAIVLNPIQTSQVVIGLANGSIVKSADGGLSWQLAKDFNDRVNRMSWQNGNIFVLLQAKGLYASQDFGINFTQISTSLSSANINNVNDVLLNNNTSLSFNQFYVDAVSPNLMYITSSVGLYKSLDGGKTWSFIKLPVKEGKSVARAITVANTSSNLVFTNIGSTIYKSTDGGTTWQTQKVATNGEVNYIIVDPVLPQIVWAGIYGK